MLNSLNIQLSVKGPCLVCACLRVVMSNRHMYCVVFLLCFSQSCGAYDASFSGLSIFDCLLGVLQHYLICHVTNKYSDIISVGLFCILRAIRALYQKVRINRTNFPKYKVKFILKSATMRHLFFQRMNTDNDYKVLI